jgi:hypothetical protein
MAWTWPRTHRLERADGVAAAGGLRSGLIGGLLASLCCLPPALALALGFGGSTFLVSLGAYQTEFHVAGLALTGVALWWSLRRRTHACRVKRSRLPFLALALGTFVASYLTLIYVVTPFLYDVYARR